MANTHVEVMRQMQAALEAMERATQTNDARVQAAASQQCRVALSAAKAVLKPNREGMRYYKNDACMAEGSDSPDCICWTPITKAVQPQAQGEVRLFDSQWINVVNHDACYAAWSKEDAIAHAVKMTERYISENVTQGKLPLATAPQLKEQKT